jgi:hypothetical protein
MPDGRALRNWAQPLLVAIGMKADLFIVALAGVVVALACSSAHAVCRFDRVGTLPVISRDAPIIRVEVDGHSLPMVVDTGTRDIVIAPQTLSALHVSIESNRTIISSAVTGSITSHIAVLQSLQLGAIRLSNIAVLVQTLPYQSATGIEPVGLIGLQVLRRYDVDFDLPHQEITLYRHSGCRPPWDSVDDTVPLLLNGHGDLLIPVQLNSHLLKAQLDSGAYGSVLTRFGARQLNIFDEQLADDRTIRVRTVGANVFTVHRHRFESLKIGDDLIARPILGVIDNDVARGEMFLGFDYMRTRRIFISFSGGKFYIRSTPAQTSSPPLLEPAPEWARKFPNTPLGAAMIRPIGGITGR